MRMNYNSKSAVCKQSMDLHMALFLRADRGRALQRSVMLTPEKKHSAPVAKSHVAMTTPHRSFAF